jgi:hypothetical protein
MLSTVGLLVAAGAIWMAFEYGQWQQIYARMSAIAHFDRDQAPVLQLEKIRNENAELKQRLTILERAAQIDREADDRLKEHIRKLQDEAYSLREELAFYRKVVGNAKDADGLRVQALRLSPTGDPGRFQYRLVLTNLNKDDKVTDGDATIEVAGNAGGQAQRFMVTTMRDGARTANLAFSFVHFYSLEGDVTLPSGLVPESVRVVIRQQGVDEPRQDTTYDWKALVKAEG